MANAYKIPKTVHIGSSFIEHIYEEKNENIFGRWLKVGQEVQLNVSNSTSICDYCLSDSAIRSNNKVVLPETSGVLERSYQVHKRTKSYHKVNNFIDVTIANP